MDPHSFIARAEAQRWLGIAEKLLISHDLVGSKTFAIRARESDPRLEAAEQILAIADTLLAAEKRVVGNNGAHQPDFYAILQLVRFAQDTEHIASQYRRLAVLLNPHQNRYPYSDQAFQLVNDAWAVLSNPMRKSMYDSDLDYPQQQQMNNLGFNLEQQHHQQQQHQQQQQQPHNFFSINQELPEQPQTFQSRMHQSHQQQQQQQLQQHNFLSQPNPVRPLPVREQEQMFQHREQEHLFQAQVQPFQVTSPPHQQNRPSPQPHIQSPSATPQSPFSWQTGAQQSQSQFQHHQMKQEQQQQHHHQHQIKQEQHHQHEQQLQQQMKQEQLKQQQLKQEQLKQQQQQEQLKQLKQQQFQQQQKHMQEEKRKQQQLLEEQRNQQLLEEQRKQQQLLEEQQRKQQQILEEQRKQQQLQEEQRKQQQLLEEQRKQQQLQEEQQKKQQQLLEEQRKQQQLLEEQRKQQQLLEEQRKQQLLEEQRKQQQLLEEQQRQQQLQEEQRKQQQLQEEQRKQQQLQEQQKQESLKQNAAPGHLPNQVNNDNNGVREEETEPAAETEPEPEDDSTTFWTACPYCFYMYEYPKLYVECTLRCDNCKRAFQAVPIASPPPIIEGQDAYFYCWGFFPIGISLSHLQDNKSTRSSNWTPFSSLHTTSNNKQNHLNEQAAPKQNLFVNKSSGPRIYIDDITDDVFTGVPEPCSDSDIEWKNDIERNSAKKQKLKKMDKGFKERIQVLALRATYNTSVKNLKNGVEVPTVLVVETNKKHVGSNPKKQSKLDLNVREQGEGDNVGGGEFFEGLDEYLSNLPILSVVNDDKVTVA